MQHEFNFAEWLLFEEKQQRVIMYHGTSANNLNSILNNGLVPFPKKRVWDTDTYDNDSGFDHPSKASIGGIYLTTNLLTATSASTKAKGNQLLVVLSIHPYSTVADEDDFLRINHINIPGMVNNPHTVAGVYIPYTLLKLGKTTDVEDENYIKKAKEEFVRSSIDYFKKKTSIHPALESRLRQILNDEGFEAALQRQAAHINPESFNDWCLRYSRWGNDGCPIKLPNKTESERRWSRFLDQITRTFKKISYEKMSPLGLKAVNQTSRLLNPVGFSGKDRIICLIEILPPAKGSYSYRLLIHYGNPPEQLKTDWQAKEGQWIVVNKREEI